MLLNWRSFAKQVKLQSRPILREGEIHFATNIAPLAPESLCKDVSAPSPGSNGNINSRRDSGGREAVKKSEICQHICDIYM